MPGRILAIGGSSLGTRIDDLVLELAGGPRVLFVPTASTYPFDVVGSLDESFAGRAAAVFEDTGLVEVVRPRDGRTASRPTRAGARGEAIGARGVNRSPAPGADGRPQSGFLAYPRRDMSREVKLSSADRVLFPEVGVTKGDLFAYYDAVAEWLVPHLRNRPFTMKRYREGARGPGFFQKQAPKGMPGWIPTRRFTTHPREGGSRLVDFPLVNSREALLWMVQFHCIDMNAWYSRVDKPDRPDFVLFDLDPPDDGFQDAIRVAHLLRELLDTLELRSYVKTSGADGIHVLVPITRRSGFDDTYAFAEAASRRLEDEHPGLVTTEWLKRKREGVLVDHRQNGWGKTIASVYSVRPKPTASVSTPLDWDELTETTRPSDFSMDVVLERARRLGDLFEPVLRGGQALAPARKRLARL